MPPLKTSKTKVSGARTSPADILDSLSSAKLGALVFVVSAAFNSYSAFTSIAPIYPDEIFQTVEMGHKLAFGRGFTYWEYVVGARSWVAPGMIAAVYKAIDLFGVRDPYFLNALLKLFLGLLHASATALVFFMIERRFGKAFGFLLSLPIASHYLAAYISARTLTECIAIPFMIAAVFFADRHLKNESLKALVVSGAFAGLAYMIRFQSAPFASGILAVVAIWSRQRIASSLVFLGAAAFMGIAVQGAVDLVSYGSFLKSIIAYLDYNVVKGIAARHGENPFHFYFKSIYLDFNAILLFLAILIAASKTLSRNYAVLLLPILLFLGVHTAIGHKETRFVFPVYYFVIVLGPLAVAEIALRLKKKRRLLFVSVSVLVMVLINLFEWHKFGDRWNATPNESDFAQSKDHDVGRTDISIELGRIQDLKSAYVAGLSQIDSGGNAYFHKDAEIVYQGDPEKAKFQLAELIAAHRPGLYAAVSPRFVDVLEPLLREMVPVKESDKWRIYRTRQSQGTTILNPAAEAILKEGKMRNLFLRRGHADIWLKNRQHADTIEISIERLGSYEVNFMLKETLVGRMILEEIKSGDGALAKRKIEVPKETAKYGYDGLNIAVIPSEYKSRVFRILTDITLSNSNQTP